LACNLPTGTGACDGPGIWVGNLRASSLADLRASHVEAWVKSVQDKGLELTIIRTPFANVRSRQYRVHRPVVLV
jgi:hypothetical protein